MADEKGKKGQTLNLGGRRYYSLSSYDPVSITVQIGCAIEEDVDAAMEDMARDFGIDVSDIDDAWVAKNFGDLVSVAELRDEMFYHTQDFFAEDAEDQKPRLVAHALAERLEQGPSEEDIELIFDDMLAKFEHNLSMTGQTLDGFAKSFGGSRDMVEAMFWENARDVAAEDAALDAYARERKLRVCEDEFVMLLDLNPEEMPGMVANAKEAGAYDELVDAALRAKALNVAVAECTCEYEHETPEEAKERFEASYGRDFPGAGSGAGAASGFKLV